MLRKTTNSLTVATLWNFSCESFKSKIRVTYATLTI